MNIAKVHIKGFRSLEDVEVDVTDYTCLIGKNDCGKSSFLRALHILFDPQEKLSQDDLCKFRSNTSEPCFVEAVLENCQHSMAVRGKLRIRRIMQLGSSQWQAQCNVPQSQLLRDMSEGDCTKSKINEAKQNSTLNSTLCDLIEDHITNVAPNGRATKENWREIYSRIQNSDLIEWENGWASFNSDELQSLVQVVFLKADMRAAEEVDDNNRSVFGRVAGFLLKDALSKHSKITEARKVLEHELQQIVKDSQKKWPIDELNEIEELFHNEVAKFDENVRTECDFIAPRLPIFEFGVRIKISDNCVEGLDKMGHGLQRSVVFAMLRIHHTLKTKQNSPQGVENSQPLYLFLAEEPELYLHPQAERQRKKELVELSRLLDAQVVLCTHSAIFVDLAEFKGILRFSRPERTQTMVTCFQGDELNDDDKKAFNAIYWFDPNRAAMLFADHVILTEGETEKIIVPALAERDGIDITNVEIVDCGGNGNIPTYQKVLEGFGVKYVAWLDTDAQREVNKARDARTSAGLGKIILTPGDWEEMTEVTVIGRESKSQKGWEHFILRGNEPNDATIARIRAAYNWEDYETA